MSRDRFEAGIRHERRVTGGSERVLDLSRGREVVPAVWMTPTTNTAAPAALLLHGFSSSKERMAQSVGRELLALGVASLALDLPFHGERDGDAGSLSKNPLALVGAWRSAIAEARDAITWLASQPGVDAGRLGIVGYSLGGFLALMAAAEDERLRVVALAAAGDLPDHTPYASLVRGLVNPLRAAERLDGRPLLLVNGRRDTTTRPAQAQRLFDAAREPKTLHWYEGGHWPPASAIALAARWVADGLSAVGATRSARPRRTG
ncbi:MAG TPA: alpha/beta fold hydrolase [Gemmatimonadaceae bacterium]|nr:alpha/beta fold hydrolase [Gemmatimonadaceae bacterium]